MYGYTTPNHYRKSVAITPHDTTPVSPQPRAVLCLTTGNLNCRLSGDTANTLFTGIAANVILPIRVQLILSTSTTGTWKGLI